MNERQKAQVIATTISRIKSTISSVGAAAYKGDIPTMDITNTLWMVEGQLEQLEKLLKFEVKE